MSYVCRLAIEVLPLLLALGCGSDADAPSSAAGGTDDSGGGRAPVEAMGGAASAGAAAALGGAGGAGEAGGAPTLASPEGGASDACDEYAVGAGIGDITGPFNEISTGYNSPGEQMEGLAMRLYSRAFAFESPCTGQRVAFASVDTLHMYQRHQARRGRSAPRALR